MIAFTFIIIFAIIFEFVLAFIFISSKFDFLFWSSLLCICLFANDSRTQNLRSLYHEHTSSSLNHVSRCSWYQQAKRTQENYHLRKHELKIKNKLKKKMKQLTKQKKKVRITTKRIEEYTCRRCKHSIKFDSNIKFHEHICTRHVKKLMSVVSLSAQISESFVSSFQSIIFSSFSSSKLIVESSVISSEFSSEFLSIETSRKSISWAEIVSRQIVALKFSRLSIATFKSMCNTLKKSAVNCSLVSSTSSRISVSTRLYLIVNDLFRMFVEKSKSFDLQSRQNKSSFLQKFDKCNSRNFELIQNRISSYFNAMISFAFKSIKFETFESTHVNENVSRQFAISLSILSISTSFFRFSKISRFSSICKHCQERSVTRRINNWFMSSVSKIENNEISMRVHSLTIKRFARFRSTLREYWFLLEKVITLRELACCLFVCLFYSFSLSIVNRLFRHTLKKHWFEGVKSYLFYCFTNE